MYYITKRCKTNVTFDIYGSEIIKKKNRIGADDVVINCPGDNSVGKIHQLVERLINLGIMREKLRAPFEPLDPILPWCSKSYRGSFIQPP